jgi:hypothetical protein
VVTDDAGVEVVVEAEAVVVAAASVGAVAPDVVVEESAVRVHPAMRTSRQTRSRTAGFIPQVCHTEW